MAGKPQQQAGYRKVVLADGTVVKRPAHGPLGNTNLPKAPVQHGRKNPTPRKYPVPKDVVQLAYHSACELPSMADIAASFGVSDQTFARWRKENPAIDAAIAKARRKKTKSITDKVEERALQGDIQAADRWMKWFRHDLVDSGTARLLQPAVQVNLAVIPPPQDLREWLENRKETAILGEVQAHAPPLTPLFQGRPTNEQEADDD